MGVRCFVKLRGFTIVEIIVVMVILSIVAILGSSKFFSKSSYDNTRYHQEVLSAFRYAQKIAIASQDPVTLCLTSNSYVLYYASNCSGSKVKRPSDQGNYEDTLGVSISPVANITFNASGEASSTGATSFIMGGFNIVIEPETGFIHD